MKLADATVYEYFIKSFARAEGHRGGEFFTPASVTRLLVEMLEPRHIREREALRTLVRNGWFEASDSGVQLRIKLGERARKVREGKEEAKAAA